MFEPGSKLSKIKTLSGLKITLFFLFFFRHYDVIVVELGTKPGFPRANPGDYTNKDIALEVDGLYVAGRVTDDSKFGEVFVIGGGKEKHRRKRRSLTSR